MKNSKQRNLILEIINSSHDHLTAQEVYDIARSRISNISLGTVYRNLNMLVEHNLIRKIFVSDGFCRYDKMFDNHNHFICDICHKIYDLKQNNNLDDYIDGNKVLKCDIIYNGICHTCLNKEEK